MTLKHQLDDIDLKILEIISKNARIPFKDVAAVVGVSRAAVHQRVNRMIDLDVIIGSRPDSFFLGLSKMVTGKVYVL